VALTSCPADKIRVIENPLREEFIAKKTREFNGDCPVILQVGTSGVKNLSNTIVALKGISCVFRIVGILGKEQIASLKSAGINYQNVSGLTNDELKAEYLNADIVVFCSTYEGFGLPIIESQATGTPLITSDLSPMKEVAGQGAILADPYDPVSINEALMTMISNPDIRTRAVEEGRKNILRFSPEYIAGQYADLYREILDSNPTRSGVS
jgi:glycosyltransferase involved in cell wall biosynthesis